MRLLRRCVFKAKSAAGTVVDAARVIDQMNVIDSVEITPPEFKLEILRTGKSVSLMGMLPARYGVDSLIASINGAVGAEAQISQLLQTADFPVPKVGQWRSVPLSNFYHWLILPN